MKKSFFTLIIFFIIFPQYVLGHDGHPDSYNEISTEPKFSQHQYDMLINELWEQGYSGKNVNVAILDSGIDGLNSIHSEFLRDDKSKVINGVFCPQDEGPCQEGSNYNDVDKSKGHGTHIAGIIAANHDSDYNDSNHLDGIAPDVNLYAVKMLEYDAEQKITFGTEHSLKSALEWVISTWNDDNITNNIHIINMSNGSHKDHDSIKPLLQQINDLGILMIAATGNYNPNDFFHSDNVLFPASNENVIAVSNVYLKDKDYILYDGDESSSYGEETDITAVGKDIYSTFPSTETNNEIYNTNTGTSMAAPMVTGVLALLREKYPTLSASELKELLLRMTKPMSGTNSNGEVNCTNKDNVTELSCKTDEYGHGFLQAEVGKSIENINVPFDYKNYNIYNLPNEDFVTTDEYIGGSNAGPIRFFRNEENGDTYFELETNEGYRWIKDNNYRLYGEQEFSRYLELKHATPLYEFPEYEEKHQGKFISEIKSDTHFIKTTGKWTDPSNITWYKVQYDGGTMWIKENDVVDIKEPHFQMEDFKTDLVIDYTKTVLYELPYSDKSLSFMLDTNHVSTSKKFIDDNNEIWFEIITEQYGKLWIKPNNFITTEPIKMTIGETTNFYDSKEGNILSSTVSPETVDVYQKSGDWYKLDPLAQETWIHPKEIFTGKFPLTIEYSSLGGSSSQKNIYFYDAPNGNVTGIANLEANEPSDTTTKFPLTFQAFQKNGSWYEVLYDNTKQWVNTDKGYIGSFQIQLTSPETKLFDEVSTSPIENGLTLEPQIVTVREHYYTGTWNESYTDVIFTPWFKVDTVWGEKWIIHNEVDIISE